MAHENSEEVSHLTKEEHDEAERILKELPIKAVATLHGIFEKLDDDNNGFLNSKELKKYITENYPDSNVKLVAFSSLHFSRPSVCVLLC